VSRSTLTRRHAGEQLDLVALIAYAEPGAQLDLVEEVGVELVGPSTVVDARPLALFALEA
jgi:hypothetical protein